MSDSFIDHDALKNIVNCSQSVIYYIFGGEEKEFLKYPYKTKERLRKLDKQIEL